MTNARGVCPLAAAIENLPQQGERSSGARTICRLLLEFKGDLESKNRSGQTVVEQASSRGRPDVADMLTMLSNE